VELSNGSVSSYIAMQGSSGAGGGCVADEEGLPNISLTKTTI
jgi:hypothetical protein